MTLPATFAEVDALLARSDIAFVRDGKLALWGIYYGRWFEEDASDWACREQFKAWAFSSPGNMVEAVELARAGWTLAFDVLQNEVLEYQNRREHPPIYLAGFAMDLVARKQFPRTPGPVKSGNVTRDLIIALIVRRVSERYRLPPIRNAVSRRRPSGCSIVKDGLELEHVLAIAETGVNTIGKETATSSAEGCCKCERHATRFQNAFVVNGLL